ncbi:hypothetical protein Y032_0092g2580 [Ancylostoma ceylanicum]|uniref:Uncharacterized protein n=1 Tax=Ancylostoma ceylanicum TaxID=53326 RepID=A0A016TMG0_9BILA|nr:hypothetical protein Y032_0092g2580 [Ancylostoma ceylanicum]
MLITFALLSAITFINVYATTDVCQQQFFEVGNSTGYATTTKTLENSIAFSKSSNLKHSPNNSATKMVSEATPYARYYK